MSHGAVDRRAGTERLVCGRLLAIHLMAPERGPSDGASGDESAEQQDECDGDELSAESR